MALRHRKRWPNLHVCLGKDASTHRLRLQQVQVFHASRVENQFAHCGVRLGVDTRLREFQPCLPDNPQAGPDQQQTDHQSGDEVSGGEPVHRGEETDKNRNAGEGIGAMVHRVGTEQRMVVLAGHPHGRAVQAFFGEDGDAGHHQRGLLRRHPDLALQALSRFKHQHDADDHDEQTHGERGQGLEPAVAVRMVLVGFGSSEADGDVDHDIGNEVRQRMEGVRQQGDAAEDDASHGLQGGQDEVDEAPSQRDASRRAVFFHTFNLTR